MIHGETVTRRWSKRYIHETSFISLFKKLYDIAQAHARADISKAAIAKLEAQHWPVGR